MDDATTDRFFFQIKQGYTGVRPVCVRACVCVASTALSPASSSAHKGCNPTALSPHVQLRTTTMHREQVHLLQARTRQERQAWVDAINRLAQTEP